MVPLDSRTDGGWVVPEVKVAFLSFDLGDVASGGCIRSVTISEGAIDGEGGA